MRIAFGVVEERGVEVWSRLILLLHLAAELTSKLLVDSSRSDTEDFEVEESHNSLILLRWGATRVWYSWMPSSVQIIFNLVFFILGAVSFSSESAENRPAR